MIETSQSTAALDEAMARAQSQIQTAAKDKVNPAFRSRYADLASVWEACRDALTSNGVFISQWPVHSDDNRLHIITRLAFKGEWIKAHFSIPVLKQDAHGYGSSLTYAKRMSLAAAVGVVADDDDDGNAASGRTTDKPAAKPFAKPGSVHPDRTMSEPDTAAITGTAGVPKNGKAKELYETLIREMEMAKTAESLKEWLKLRRADVEALPQEWLEHFDEAYSFRKESLGTVRAA